MVASGLFLSRGVAKVPVVMSAYAVRMVEGVVSPLVEEDEGEAGDGARVVGVGVEVCALDDASVCVCAHVLTVRLCPRSRQRCCPVA